MSEFARLLTVRIMDRFELPDSVIELIYLLLDQLEQEDNKRTSYDLRESIVIAKLKALSRDATYIPTLKRTDPQRWMQEIDLYAPVEPLDFAELSTRYFERIDFIFKRLPPITDAKPGAINVPIHELANLALEDYVSLGIYREERPFRSLVLSDLASEDRRFTGDPLTRFINPKFWQPLLRFKVGIAPHPKIRFEHTQVIGATGAGKTQLLQNLIAKDIESDATVIVMAPKGNMIPTLERLKSIDPERLVLVLPEHPIALNIFDLGSQDVVHSVELINYILDSVLGSETTSKQTSLLNCCIRLLLLVEGATIRTLVKLLECETLPEMYEPYVDKLPEVARDFFRNQFGHPKQYRDTKTEIRWRLDSFLLNPVAEMLYQPKTRLNIREAIEAGKVILIDTSVSKFGNSGSKFIGRVMVALITLAMRQRDTKKKLRSVYFYIDEARDYLTENIEAILEKAREACVGLTIAHQDLGQLYEVSPHLQKSVLANTATKYVGRCLDEDAKRLAGTMQVPWETLHFQETFNFRVRMIGYAPGSFSMAIKPGRVEAMPKRSEEEVQEIRKKNAERYGIEATTRTHKPKTTETDPDVFAIDEEIESRNKFKK